MAEMKPGWINSGMEIGGIRQPKGFDIRDYRREYFVLFGRRLWCTKTIYLFELNELHPLTFIHPDGRWIQPGRRFPTDQGSVPRLCQLIVIKDRFLGFYLHDFGYEHGYVWVSWDCGKTWVKQYLTRRGHDELLDVSVRYDPAPAGVMERAAVWAGVRSGGWCAWNRYRKGVRYG